MLQIRGELKLSRFKVYIYIYLMRLSSIQIINWAWNSTDGPFLDPQRTLDGPFMDPFNRP